MNNYINNHLKQVETLAEMVRVANALVTSLQARTDIEIDYNEELRILVTEYNTEVFLLKKELENYFKLEEVGKFPINLNLRRAYSELKLLS